MYNKHLQYIKCDQQHAAEKNTNNKYDERRISDSKFQMSINDINININKNINISRSKEARKQEGSKREARKQGEVHKEAASSQ